MSVRRLIKNFAAFISRKNEYTKDLEEQIEYSLRITVFETLKIFGVLFFFSILGHSVEAAVAVGTMAIIKPFIGGYHEDTQVGCFAAALVIVACVIYLSINLKTNFISKLILSGVSLYCIWNQAPVLNPKMTLTRVDLIMRNRKVGLFLTALFIIISLVTYRYDSVSNSILWIIVIQALLMFNKRKLGNIKN